MQTFEQYCNENWRGAAAAALMSLAGGTPGEAATQPQQAIGRDFTKDQYPTPAQRASMPLGSRFIYDWGHYYQTDKNLSKVGDAARRLNQVMKSGQYKNVPMEAKRAMLLAVNIFGGDAGSDKNELMHYLLMTGWIESGYRTKVQDGGPARSYWQVEPETATSLVTHSSAYFGAAFERSFKQVLGPGVLNQLKRYTPQQWSELLEHDDNMGAAMAAAKWIVTKYHEENKAR